MAFPILLTALEGAWVLGFWLVLIALLTDFFDGLAAKKLHAESVLGGHIDRVSDFLLAALGGMGLIFGADLLPAWVLLPCGVVAVFVGYVKFVLPEEHRLRLIVNPISVTLLFAAWIIVVWGYGWQAFGWSWLYIPITLALLVSAARLKLHRLRYWFGWITGKPPRSAR
jgi:phosphatidylglycerophosphate synthase